MFGLFSDYKSPEVVEFEFSMKRLKTHYKVYSSLIGLWEELILNNTKFMIEDSDIGDAQELKEYYQKGDFTAKEVEREFKKVVLDGYEETLEELNQKLTKVEMMMGSRLIAKNIAQKEISLSETAKNKVKGTEGKISELRTLLQGYPLKVGQLNRKIGQGLVKKNRLMEVLDVLEVVKYSKLLGATSKREMMRLLREQDWGELEPHKFHDIQSVKKAITSLKGKLPHFEKEIKDEFCMLLQKPNFEGYLSLIQFLYEVYSKQENWIDHATKYEKLFQSEMNHVYSLLSSPSEFIESSISRQIDLWISPLKFSLGDYTDQDILSPKKRPRIDMLTNIEPSMIISCLCTVLENLIATFEHWNRIIKYTFVHEKNIEAKLTKESSNLGFIRSFRKSLFNKKEVLLMRSFEALEKYISVLKLDYITRISPRSLLKLRISLSNFYKEAQLYSWNIPQNIIETEYQELTECYLNQTVNTHLDLLLTIIRTSDIELSDFDYDTYAKQIQEVSTVVNEFKDDKWMAFGNGQELIGHAAADLKASITESGKVATYKVLDPLVKEVKAKLSQLTNQQFTVLSKEAREKSAQLLANKDVLESIRLDNSGSVVSSFVIMYIKLWFFFPEFKSQVKFRLNMLFQLYFFFSLSRLLAPVTMQFLMSGGFNLQELNSEEHFSQLENFHDIVLFQQRYNSLRKMFKNLNDSVQLSDIYNLREKIESSLAELLSVSASISNSKDKTGVQLQRVMKTVFSMQGVNQLSIFQSYTKEIDEITDLLFYNLLLAHTKDNQVFNKTTKIKWEDVKENESTSEYVIEVINSVRGVTSLVCKLGTIIGFDDQNVMKMNFLVVKFHINSLLDVYGSVKRISPAAKSLMSHDLKSIIEGCKKLTDADLQPLEDHANGFLNKVDYDEPMALHTIVESLPKYPLRILKNFYLYAGKDVVLKKLFTSNNLVIKTEKLVTLFELSRSCLLSLVDDQKVIESSDYSALLIEILLAANEKSKQLSQSQQQT